MGRFDIFPIFIATFASRRVTLIATHSKSQKQTRLPIRYLYFILPFKPLINKEVIKVFQNYTKTLKKARLFNRKVRKAQNACFFMRRRMIVQKKAICDNISSEKFAKNWQFDSKFLYLHI